MAKTIVIESLKDGQHTAGTGLMLRKLRAAGVIVTVCKTGRVDARLPNGDHRIYAPVRLDRVPLYKLEAERKRIEALNNPSPLQQLMIDAGVASQVEVRVGSIVLRQDGRNMIIDTAHIGGFVRGGKVVIEAGDVDDLLKALTIYVVQKTDWA
jgi:hypothetical protein